MNYKNIVKSGLLLGLFTAFFIFLVVIFNNNAKDRISYNKKQFLINQLNKLVSDYDNDILNDSYTSTVTLYDAIQNITIYPAKKYNNIFATLIKHTYPAGYSGNIELLTAIDNNNKIISTRVINHKETPGLGDKIDINKSKWILSFDGLAINDVIWKVKKKGGDFDSFTGATITPQAIITALYQLLKLELHKKLNH